jgi:hypothetical protein
MDEQTAKEIEVRNRFMRNRWLRLTPSERLEEMAKLQQRSWEILRSSPEGYAHFIRRNFKARSVRTEKSDNAS